MDSVAEPKLTPRQLEILRASMTGAKVSEVAAKFCIAEQTVKNHKRIIYKILGVRGLTEALAVVFAADMIPIMDYIKECDAFYDKRYGKSP